MESSQQTTSDAPSLKQGFIPQETVDHPFDVTLVVEDGKEFKAHRRVLSDASTFFEKLLNSDMREYNEGVVRLEMVTEVCLRDTLEFIYTGSLQISTEDNAQELIAMADYLVLPKMKTFAGEVLVEKLNSSNAFSTFSLAERYRCQELVAKTKDFILANFTAVAKSEAFLNLSNEEIKMWISSDELNVSAEEDVFRVILTWIDREKNERKKYFAELFREVRLVHVSRDFLRSDIVTNDLVNDNEGCMDRVKDAMKLIDSKDYHHLGVKPRKSLESPVIVACLTGFRARDDHILCCYYPHEDMWSRFHGKIPSDTGEIISCQGKLYFMSKEGKSLSLLCYDSFSNCWITMPHEEHRTLHNVFVRNDEDIYVLLCEDIVSCPECVSLRSRAMQWPCGKTHLSFITKYKPESNSWEDISSFDLGSRDGVCVVAKDDYIYFLGGYSDDLCEALKDADRYNISTNTWEKIADLQVARWYFHGAAAFRKIFVVGGVDSNSVPENCEMYDETTNEWQFIARLRKTPFDHYNPTILDVDNKLYSIIRYICTWNRKDRIDCYDPDKNEWTEKTQIPLEKLCPKGWADVFYLSVTFCCSMRVLKGANFLQQASFPDDYSEVDKRKCALM